MALRDLSLRLKLSAVFVVLLAAIMLFVQLFVPARMAERAQQWAERRATGMAIVLASAMAPGLEFDDASGVKGLLGELASAPEVLYGAVRRADGSLLASWNQALVPALGQRPDKEPVLVTDGNRLHVLASVRARGGSNGVLQVGFSLERLELEQQRDRLTVGLVGLLVFVFGLGVSIALGTLLVRPIRELTRVTSNIIARGDLGQEIRVEGRDEVGVLAGSFREMVKKLRALPATMSSTAGGVVQVVDQVSQTASSVASGANIVGSRVEETSASIVEMLSIQRNIAESVETLAKDAEQSATANTQMVAVNEGVGRQVADMARAAEESTAAIEKMTSRIKQISTAIEELNASIEGTSVSMSEMDSSIAEVEINANETAKLATVASDTAVGGVGAIKKTLDGIERIRVSSAAVSKLIESLDERLSHIGDIVVVIDTVAGQTNLLALNAAIIASQAGEHGRGFAVVADEIKALANRTGTSTQEIRQLITGIQEQASKAVAAVEEGSASVNEGVRLGGEAAQALGEISSSTSMATAMVKAIASSTVEQARASRQVTSAIHRIAESIQSINEATREQARSSETVAEIAVRMKGLTANVLRSSDEQRRGAEQIAQSVESISRMVKRLANAQKEQTHGAEQVLRAVEAIREVTGGQNDAVHDLETALGSLQKHAGSLKDVMQQFRA